jgi:hypothetical protein
MRVFLCLNAILLRKDLPGLAILPYFSEQLQVLPSYFGLFITTVMAKMQAIDEIICAGSSVAKLILLIASGYAIGRVAARIINSWMDAISQKLSRHFSVSMSVSGAVGNEHSINGWLLKWIMVKNENMQHVNITSEKVSIEDQKELSVAGVIGSLRGLGVGSCQNPPNDSIDTKVSHVPDFGTHHVRHKNRSIKIRRLFRPAEHWE